MRSGDFKWRALLSVTNSSISMMINNTKIIIPTRLEWLLLLSGIGIFGFLGQVTGFHLRFFWYTKLQRYLYRCHLLWGFNANRLAGVPWPFIARSSSRLCSSGYCFTTFHLTSRWSVLWWLSFLRFILLYVLAQLYIPCTLSSLTNGF